MKYSHLAPFPVRMAAWRRYRQEGHPHDSILSFEKWCHVEGICDCGHGEVVHSQVEHYQTGRCQECQCEQFSPMRAPPISTLQSGLDYQLRFAVNRILGPENLDQPVVLTADGAVHIGTWENPPIDWEGKSGPSVAALAEIMVARGKQEWEFTAQFYGIFVSNFGPEHPPPTPIPPANPPKPSTWQEQLSVEFDKVEGEIQDAIRAKERAARHLEEMATRMAEKALAPQALADAVRRHLESPSPFPKVSEGDVCVFRFMDRHVDQVAGINRVAAEKVRRRLWDMGLISETKYGCSGGFQDDTEGSVVVSLNALRKLARRK